MYGYWLEEQFEVGRKEKQKNVLVSILQQHIFQTECKGKISIHELNKLGTTQANIMPEANILRFKNPFKIKQNMFKIKRKLLIKNTIIRFSLDRPRVD